MAANLAWGLVAYGSSARRRRQPRSISPAGQWVPRRSWLVRSIPFICVTSPLQRGTALFWLSVAGDPPLDLAVAGTDRLYCAADLAGQSGPRRFAPQKPGLRDLWKAWSFGRAGQQSAFRKQLLDVNAFYWLAGRPRPAQTSPCLDFFSG